MKTIKPPLEISWLVDAVGQEETFKFLDQYAGMRIGTPKDPARWPCGKQFSDALAKAVSDRFRGDRWCVPVCKTWRAAILNQKGYSSNEIARSLGTSFRSVGHLLGQKPSKSKPATLRNIALLNAQGISRCLF